MLRVSRPDSLVNLKEETKVHLVIETGSNQADDDDPTGWNTAEELIGRIQDAPPDTAENHDFCSYGRLRR
jgi:hypothetical protein